VLFISGHPERAGSLKPSASAFLPKPFTRQQLGKRVKQALQAAS
jgi:hypothetical protein